MYKIIAAYGIGDPIIQWTVDQHLICTLQRRI